MSEQARTDPAGQAPDTATGQYAGAFFPRSERLLISGGVFTSNVTNITQGTPNLPPDFRMIPMGDIYLHHGVGVVMRSTGTHWARRLYSARIVGKKTDMTVAMYQGDNAEQNWREDLAKYLWLRHPNFLQLYGATSSPGIHAIILHDDLIPVDAFDYPYKYPQSLMVHLLARADAEVEDAIDYFISVFHQELWDFNPIPWIDRSNGRVCLDVMSNSSLDDNPPSSQYRCTMAPGIDAVMMLNEYHRLFPPLRPEQYHSILYQNFGYDFSHHEYGHVPPIHLASILWNSEGLEAVRVGDAANPVVIPTNTVITYERWETDSSETMANGWERYESNNVADTTISLEINCERPESWLSQANRIFERLNVTSNKENYALVKSVTFELFVKPDFIPRGYLFVCPPEDFRLPGTSSFRWPHCPAYWSFDRTGAERLSMEAANCHGFPPFELRTRMKLLSWDDSDYTGLREFHESWGFNPDSEDVARHLGDLIYKVSEEESTSDDEDSFDSPIQDLYEDTAQGLPSVHLATHCGPEEFVPLSRHSKVLMVVKLALILFIAVSSAYGGVPAQFD